MTALLNIRYIMSKNHVMSRVKALLPQPTEKLLEDLELELERLLVGLSLWSHYVQARRNRRQELE